LIWWLLNIALQIKVPTYALNSRPLNTFRELICSFNVSNWLAKQHQSHESIGPHGGAWRLYGGVAGLLAQACGCETEGFSGFLATFFANLFFSAVSQEPLKPHRPKREQHLGVLVHQIKEKHHVQEIQSHRQHRQR
jgi:hypothetical protein